MKILKFKTLEEKKDTKHMLVARFIDGKKKVSKYGWNP